jgi:hypothetical protein
MAQEELVFSPDGFGGEPMAAPEEGAAGAGGAPVRKKFTRYIYLKNKGKQVLFGVKPESSGSVGSAFAQT